MGKRELLIAAAFIVIGCVAYQFTAPPAKPGQGFSFAQFWNRAKSVSENASAETTSAQTIAVTPSVREIRIRDVHGAVKIVGEDRADIAAEFSVQSTGSDKPAAAALANDTHLRVDALEDAVIIHVDYPDGGRQVASLVLKIPKRLSVRLDGGNRLDITAIAAIQVVGSTGESNISKIAGLVGGDFRAGALQVSDVGSIDLTLNNARTTIAAVRGRTRLDVRTGRCALSGSQGDVEIETRMAVLQVKENHAPVRIGGQGGRVEIASPADEIRVDVQRTDITADVRRALPMSLSTTDARLEFGLGGAAGTTGQVPPVQMDAVAVEGQVRGADWQLTATTRDRESRIEHAFGNGARVSLRTQRGDIIVKKLADIEISKGE